MNFAKKSLGQNFLIDKNIIRKIINLVKLEKKNIIEIVAGHGALTDEILKKKPNLLNIIEKDTNLFKELKMKYSGVKNIKIYTDFNSAHISLEHTGEFTLEKPIQNGSKTLSYEWLESAYLVKENNKLKFKFYFSEQINDWKFVQINSVYSS